MITDEVKQQCLEGRVDFMVDFIQAMRTNGISQEWINYFIEKDKDFIYDFCKRLDYSPNTVIQRYTEGVEVLV